MPTAEQMNQLLTLLAKIADRQYTITGAADWPILVVLGGLVVGMLGFMWVDLGRRISGQKDDNDKAHDDIWKALHDCQNDCCPRGKVAKN